MRELQNFSSLNNNNLLVVLPINKFEDFYLNECLYSLAQQESPIDLLILTNGLTTDELAALQTIASGPQVSIPKKDDKGNTTTEVISALKELNYIIKPTDADTFSKAFNEGLNYAISNSYKNFSVVEYDDVVDVKWFKYFDAYSAQKPDMDGFLPLTREISNGNFIGYFNEACWVDGFAEVAGIFDLTLLLRFSCMNITGTVFKTESIQRFSQFNKDENYYRAMKESLRVSYVYEFFLRMIYKDLKFFSIPRAAYEHRVDRSFDKVNYFSSKLPKDLLLKSEIDGGMSPDEYNFWNNLIKKEFYFDKDRNLKYEPKNVQEKISPELDTSKNMTLL